MGSLVTTSGSQQGGHLMQLNGPEVFGVETRQILEYMRNGPSVVSVSREPLSKELQRSTDNMETVVFDALAYAKIKTSLVGMHLPKTWRQRLFDQLDKLHDTSDWEDGDQPVTRESFETFLRTVLTIRPPPRPSLGLTSSGNLLAAWTIESDRLTIEFLPAGRLRVIVSRTMDGQNQRAAMDTTSDMLIRVLAPYDPARWLENAK